MDKIAMVSEKTTTTRALSRRLPDPPLLLHLLPSLGCVHLVLLHGSLQYKPQEDQPATPLLDLLSGTRVVIVRTWSVREVPAARVRNQVGVLYLGSCCVAQSSQVGGADRQPVKAGCQLHGCVALRERTLPSSVALTTPAPGFVCAQLRLHEPRHCA